MMGKDTPDIMEGDGEADIITSIIELLGLDFWDYMNDKSILSREYLEQNIDKVLKVAKDPSKSPGYYQILGYYILKTGASISDDLRNKIAEVSQWKYEETIYPSKEIEEERKIILKDLRDKIINHIPGRITELLEDGGRFGPTLLIPEKILRNLLEKGCLLQRIFDILKKKDDFKKITMDTLIENFRWHFYRGENQSVDAIFKHSQKNILAKIFVNHFAMGVRTPIEMQERFASADNPEGIPLVELEELVLEYLEVGSWKEAITKYGYPDDASQDIYIKEACGIDTSKDYKNEPVIARERVEENYKKLIFMIDRWEDPIGYLNLGLLILETGSKLTYNVKTKILEFTNRLINNQDANINIDFIRSFQDKINEHIPGKITDLILTKKELELWKNIKQNINKITSLQYIINEGIVSGISLKELEFNVKKFFYSLRGSFKEENRKLADKLYQMIDVY